MAKSFRTVPVAFSAPRDHTSSNVSFPRSAASAGSEGLEKHTNTEKHNHVPEAAGGEMLEDRRVRPSDDLLLAVFVALAVVVPFLIGYRGEAIAEAISRFLSPIGLLLLPIGLLLMIQFLSSEQATFFSNAFSTGGPDSIHRASGSPVGVALFLVLVLFLLYNRISIFGGVDGSHE